MIRTGGGAAQVVALPPTASPSWKPARRHSPFGSGSRDVGTSHRHQPKTLICRGAQGVWRTAEPHHGGRPIDKPGAAGGPPPLLQTAAYVLAAIVAFNVLRALVLACIAWAQRRPRSTPAAAQAQSAPLGGPEQRSEPSPLEALDSAPLPTSALTDSLARFGGAGASVSAAPGTGTAAAAPDQTLSTAGRSEPRQVAAGGSAVEFERPSPSETGRGSLQLAAAAATAAVGVAGGTGGPASAPQPTTAAEAAEAAEGGQIRIASAKLRSRGTARSTNLGRVVFCAALDQGPATGASLGPGSAGAAAPAGAAAGTSTPSTSGTGVQAPWRSLEWHQRFWEPLLTKYSDGPDDRVTGLLVLYGNSVLHILEGDNNALFALLRELRPEDVGVHRLAEIRVPCFILDLRQRLFDRWDCAALPPPRRPRGLTRAALRQAAPTGATVPPPPPAAAGAAPGADDGAGVPEVVLSPEEELVRRIRDVERFVKAVGPRLAQLESREARAEALGRLRQFESSTPPEAVVTELATDQLAPSLHDFVDTFDADYRRYVSLLSLLAQADGDDGDGEPGGGGGGGGPWLPSGMQGWALLAEVRHLARFYGEHLQRDIEEAAALEEEEAELQQRASSSADEVASRLARGMRLKPASVAQPRAR